MRAGSMYRRSLASAAYVPERVLGLAPAMAHEVARNGAAAAMLAGRAWLATQSERGARRGVANASVETIQATRVAK